MAHSKRRLVRFNSLKDITEFYEGSKYEPAKVIPLLKEIVCTYPNLCVNLVATVYDGGTEDENILFPPYALVAFKSDPSREFCRVSQNSSRWVGNESRPEYVISPNRQVDMFSRDYREKRSTKIKEIMKTMKKYSPKDESSLYLGNVGTYDLTHNLNSEKTKAWEEFCGEKSHYKDPEEIASMIAQGYVPVSEAYIRAIERHKKYQENADKMRKWSPSVYHIFKDDVTEKYTVHKYKCVFSKGSHDAKKGRINILEPVNDKQPIQYQVCREELPDAIDQKMSVMEITTDPNELAIKALTYSDPAYYKGVGTLQSPNRWWVLLDE